MELKWEKLISGDMGGFLKKISEAYLVADKENRKKISQVYPELEKAFIEWFNK